MLIKKSDNKSLKKNWQAYFFQRYLKLKLKFIPPLNKERAQAQNPKVFQRYFNLF
jgi:hypothetical protein